MDAELMDIGRTLTTIPQRPLDPAPPRSAPYEVRAEWSERYVAWLIWRTPVEGPLPKDVGATHRYEIEFSSCVMDPQTYERQTQDEVLPETVH